MDENIDAWELWIEVRTQWRGAGMGIVGLDYNALYREAERLEIELSPCNMKKIKCLEAMTLKGPETDAESNRSRTEKPAKRS